jgi:hypothetical protein
MDRQGFGSAFKIEFGIEAACNNKQYFIAGVF